jgi:phospholipid/cholesterol/gamma-HCH transport system substrate-binding protein
LPRTLRAAQPALDALNRSFPGLRGFARDIRPGVENSEETIDVSLPLLKQLRGLVSQAELRGLTADLRPTVPALASFTNESIPLSKQVRQAASCQTEVILPWSKDKLVDEKFPSTGPVYTELPKPFPGLAGESRSGDANGKWFRVLVASGTNLVTLRPGVFATTAMPILGTNPPRPSKRPPLNQDVRCQTQEPPNLASEPGKPPEQHKLDTSSAAYKTELAKAREQAIGWLRGQLKLSGLEDKLKVSGTDATKATIDQLLKASKAGK